mmetsp:Transcript_2135/g.5969  ORF Transcript_2135/g.5969 Transcript_2135/m.5969 type:complete len:261 (+) Transcript_2135:2-784(+)
MSTPGWLSAYVLKTCVFFAGMVVPRSISLVITPPAVSMPRDRGATSSNNTSLVASPVAPDRMPACTAAPYATASSGLMRWLSSFPSKKSRSRLWTFGTRVDPPTNTTWSTSAFLRPASFSTLATGFKVRLNKSEHSSSNFAREIGMDRSIPWCTASTSTVVWVAEDNARFASSHCFRMRCKALGSSLTSMPLCLRLKDSTQCAMSRWSKSSPPRCVSPEVALTSNTPLSMVNNVTSKVPPPKSNTRTFSSLPPSPTLSNP